MRRLLVACLLTCGAVAVPSAVASSSLPRATLRGFVCQRSSNHLDRAIEVTGVMRPVTGTQAMAMKFVLLRRAVGGGAYAPVSGKDLGRWLTPTPPTLGQRSSDVWRLDKLVVNLPAQSFYRFHVSFRWTASSSTVLSRTVLSSPVCAE
ncbi:MAG TPA: hypothetical protein VKR21_07645 [Solirubrobacteraceae bacterium]|nr:hypothetical protein [Solirubrobacteraceae bacterium]